jgi:hypothetical protein
MARQTIVLSLFLLAAAVSLCGQPLNAQPKGLQATAPDELTTKRKWQDASGQFSIEAEFITLQDGKVELKKPDGKTVLVPLDKLAAADQEIARRLMTADNPFELNVTEAKPKPVAITELKISLAGARKMHPIPDAPWSMQADPAPPLKEFSTAPIFIPNEKGYSYFRHPHLDVGNGWVWMFLRNFEGDTRAGRIERIDLSGRKQLARIPTNFETRILDISPSGKWVAVMLNEGKAAADREFQLWSVNGQEVQPVRSLTPFTRALLSNFQIGESDSHNVKSATFVDDRHLFVRGNGPGVLLDLQTGRGVYMVRSGEGFFSPNRRYLACVMYKDLTMQRGEVVVLESLTGKCVGKLELEKVDVELMHELPARLAFNAAGTKLAGVNARHVWVWDLQTGQVETSWHNVDVQVGPYVPDLAFGTHGQLLFNGTHCFSLRDGWFSTEIRWPNEGEGRNSVRFLANADGRSFFYLNRVNQQTEQYSLGVANYELPGAALQKAFEETDVSNRLLLKPGTRLSVKFQGPPPEMIAGFHTGIAAEFAKKNWTLVEEGEAAEFEVLYTLENMPLDNRLYVLPQTPQEPLRVPYVAQLAKMQLRKVGQEPVLFFRNTRFAPRPSGVLPVGMTVEQASQLICDWTFFENTRIHARLLKYPQYRNSLMVVDVDSEGRLKVGK